MAKNRNHDQEFAAIFQKNEREMSQGVAGLGAGGMAADTLGALSLESVSLGSFWATAWAYGVAALRMGIDTPEERQAILRAIMAAFDAKIAPRLGRYAAGVRSSLETTITNLLNTAGG